MKTSRFFIAAACTITGMLAAVSCEEKIQEGQAELILSEDVGTIGPEGGTMSIGYTISSPVEGASVHPSSDDSWIGDFDTSEDGAISFTVESNWDSEDREGSVNVEYGGVSCKYTVKQTSGVQPEFQISIDEVTETTVKFTIIPKDKEMTYCGMLNDKDYVDKFPDDASYIADDITSFKESASFSGLSFEEYMDLILKKGDVHEEPVTMLDPDSDYYIYAYGMDRDGNALTKIYKFEVRTKAVEMTDMTFDMDCQVDGAHVTISVHPSDPEGMYLYSYYAKSEVATPDDIAEKYQDRLTTSIMVMNQMYGMTAEEFMQEAGYVGDSQSELDLEENTEYWAFAVSVTTFGILNSKVSVKEFTTGKRYSSDNTFRLSFSNKKETSVDYKIVTDNDDPYVVFIDRYENWMKFADKSDNIIKELISGNYDLESKVHTGDINGTFTGLEGNTEYVVYIFGYENGKATTELYDGNFVTMGPQAELSFSLSYDKWFDGTELAALYPDRFAGMEGKALLPVKVQVPDNAAGYAYTVFTNADATDPSVITDDTLLMSLKYGSQTSPEYVFSIPYDSGSTLVGVAQDADGNYSPVYRQLVTLTKDGASPASEFVGY